MSAMPETDEFPTFVTHLECSMTGEKFAPDRIHGLSPAGRPLLVRYDLKALAQAVDKAALAARTGGFWRYREFLPVRRSEDVIRLGEVTTPLIRLPTAAAAAAAGAAGSGGDADGEIIIKDEGRLPTGSFKARGLALAVSMAKALGIEHLAMPTNGNAGAAMAAYAARAGLRATAFCPEDTPDVNVREMALQGAGVFRVNGLINDCGRIAGEGKEAAGWFDLSTLKEPYRIEGKKTMGLELAEQLNWELPDSVFYPTGGGTGLIGMWKAFDELERIGWIGSKRPKMFAVQAEGCAPIVKAFEDGAEHAGLWENAHTCAAGIRVPAAVGDFLILRAVRRSGGAALAVSDESILESRDRIARRTGFSMCPEGAAAFAAYEKARKKNLIPPRGRAVIFNCASGLKYPMPDAGKDIDRHQPVDYSAL